MKRRFYYYFPLVMAIICCGLFVHSKALSASHINLKLLLPPVTINGKIVNEDGTAFPGVIVTLKGTTIKTTTNTDGRYTIKLPEAKGILVFSYVGYTAAEVPVGSKTVIDVKMKPNVNSLDAVVVIGYGTQKQREVTSSISSIKGEEILKYNVNSFQNALQGQMPGVEMYESSGVPGAAVNVRIRGMNTINGSAGPLYVVDGIPVMQGLNGDGDAPQSNGNDQNSSHTNVMADINPNDIESIEVLKDAASSAIYGARGSGGVILITTKRGKAGKTSFNVNVISGITQISKEKKLLNGPQLLEIFDEAYRNTFYSDPANANLPLPASPLPSMTGYTRGMADTTNNNAFDHVLQTGVFRELTVSASNGTDKTKYYLSGTYKQTVGTIQGTDMNQFNFKLNIDHDLSKRIRFGASITPSYNTEHKLGSSSTLNLGGYGGALSSNLPIYPYYNADGSYFNPWTNPEAFKDRDLYNSLNKRSRIGGSVYLEVDVIKGLKFKTLAQREDWDQSAPSVLSGLLNVTNDATISVFANDQKGKATHTNSYGYSNSFDSFFTYNRVIKKKHNLNGVMGMRFSTTNGFYEALYGDNLINSNLIYPSQTGRIGNNYQTGVQGNPDAKLGYYFRVQYNYNRRYLASAVVNRDGSSRFGGDKRFGTFPAFSLGWIASDEKFLKNKVLTFLKFRGSFGLTGNSGGIGNLSAKNTWQTGSPSVSGYLGTAANMPVQPANEQLHWEKGTKYDAGIDMEFLRGKISSTVGWYKNITTDMLLSIPVPVTFGYNVPTLDLDFLENRGSLYNEGLEFSINSNILTGAFKWKSSFNISHNITRIVSLGGLDPKTVSGGQGDVQLYPGKNAPVFYLVEYVGVDPATGGELIRDKNNNTVLATSLTAEQLADARKPQYDKPSAPKFYGGFSNVFSYKSFSMNVFFSYRVGNYLLDAGERAMSYVGNISLKNNSEIANVFLGNLPESILNRWTPDNPNSDIPKVYYSDNKNNPLRSMNTTRFLSDASYVRLKNLQISYELPERLLSRIKMKSVRVNLTGQNLWMWTKFKGVDPEAITIQTNYRERNVAYGVIRNVIPLSKSVTLGLNIGF
ncbi:TonB-linked outer membrane protein, SusC/RagA family [Pedobacter sp. ok626]|uniref:SusC/RagA family TonB-linked outer membrane protein n=1 Tax=Pedobacter sp. ok626 TaxID=1761882 RepID=UPI000882B398|nr:SusC/RagA family TonB-linked outer membrane protein [Pedobacter sp. ok626]SDK26262.1 TonB-linked outer membrane protein, SusC/RagA family [Pedobacter sp. ok626]